MGEGKGLIFPAGFVMSCYVQVGIRIFGLYFRFFCLVFFSGFMGVLWFIFLLVHLLYVYYSQPLHCFQFNSIVPWSTKVFIYSNKQHLQSYYITLQFFISLPFILPILRSMQISPPNQTPHPFHISYTSLIHNKPSTPFIH